MFSRGALVNRGPSLIFKGNHVLKAVIRLNLFACTLHINDDAESGKNFV
jgi:hypothetical protein